MITISSKAGQRFAKADAALNEAAEAVRVVLAEVKDPGVYLERLRGPEEEAWKVARHEWEVAAKELAAELRANGHHMAEGD